MLQYINDFLEHPLSTTRFLTEGKTNLLPKEIVKSIDRRATLRDVQLSIVIQIIHKEEGLTQIAYKVLPSQGKNP
ncbi:hypothetical protein M8J77_025607 [Diaphorina citri]|nr:hypothetical protein M8J77_025607 [Diaphorina citri]